MSIHTDPSRQHVDVRLYFDADEDRDELLGRISEVLGETSVMAPLISAYELVSDGFGRTVPDERPIA